MNPLLEKAKRSWHDLLRGDITLLLRVVIPLVLVLVLVILLNASDLVSWQISLFVLACLGIIRLSLISTSKSTEEHYPPKPTQPPHQLEPVKYAKPPFQGISLKQALTNKITQKVAPQVEEPELIYDDAEPTSAKPIPQTVADQQEALYDSHFHWMWLVEKLHKTALIAIVATYFLATDGPAGVVMVVYAYVAFVSWYNYRLWKHLRFVVTNNTYSLPREMPWPFSNRTPTIRVIEITYAIHENWLDKLLGTARLVYDDKPGSGDDEFRNVRWLPRPDKVRTATGSPDVHKSTWHERRRLRRDQAA